MQIVLRHSIKMVMARIITLSLLAVICQFLQACSSGGSEELVNDNSPPLPVNCVSFGYEEPLTGEVAWNFRNVELIDDQSVVDTNEDTFFTFRSPDATDSGTLLFRVSTQEQEPFSPGVSAGVIIGIPGGINVGSSFSARTFLGEAIQEEATLDSAEFSVQTSDGYSKFEVSVSTTLPFDGVQVVFARSGPSPSEFRIYEFCSEFISDHADGR